MINRPWKIGQIVPSSNVTMETEIPAMLTKHQNFYEDRFTFHSSRMRLKSVTKEELQAMDCDSDRCALELSDARVDVLGYACLVAIMSMGKGYHRVSEKRLHECTKENGCATPVVTSAGALVQGLHTLKAKKISIITPYMKPLTKLVVDYIEGEDIEVVDSISLEVSDNVAVGQLDPNGLLDIYKKLQTSNVDAVVLSACVQMPSLGVVQKIEDALGIPVTTAAISTTYQMLKQLNLTKHIPDCGMLLSGKY